MLLLISLSLCVVILILSGLLYLTHRGKQKELHRQTAVERSLKEEKKFVTEILSTIGSLIVVLDKDGTIVRFNKACQSLTAYDLEDVIGRKVWDFLLLPDDIEPVKQVFNSLRAGDFPNNYENYWLTKSGEKRLLAWNNTVLTDEYEQVINIIGTGIDITEQRKFQQELTDSHNKLEEYVVLRTEQLADANKQLKNEIEERKVTQQALKQSEKSIKELYEISSVVAQPFEERVQDLLKLGCSHFSLPIGIFASIKENNYKVVSAISPGNLIQNGAVFELGDTYCQNVLKANEPIGFEYAKMSDWHLHPAYKKFKLESYLGTRVNLGNETFGTLNFSSPKPQNKPFTNVQKEFLKLMANWLGEELLRQKAEEKFRALLESAPDGIIVVDCNAKIVLVNEQIEKLFGYQRQELIQRDIDILLPERVRLSHKKYISQYFSNPFTRTMTIGPELYGLHKNGYEFPVEISLSPFETEEGLLVSGVIRDISDRLIAESELRRAAKVFENTNEAIIIADDEYNIVAVNQAFSKITGYIAEEVLLKKPTILKHDINTSRFDREQKQALGQCGQWKGETRNRRKNGETYPVLENISVVKDPQGKVVNYITVFSDISVIKESEARLNYLAHHDALTNLPNRLLFNANLQQAIEHSKRYKLKLALLFLDLDRFKLINDTLGHSFGDALLQKTAKRIQMCTRGEDTVARLGGDEFTIIMSEINQENDAATLATKVINSLAKAVNVDGKEIISSVSIGISIYPDDAQDSESLVKVADTAMYHAKELGKNNYQFYTQSLSDKVYEHMSIEAGLRQALQNNELQMFYQPMISLDNNQIVGLEALIRWLHPEQGVILPDQFIPIAEETGLINEVGEWVLRNVCQQLNDWRTQDLPDFRVSVNLSGKQILNEKSMDKLENILAQSGFSSSNIPLDLEITESVLQTEEQSVTNLTRLKSRGVRLAIDDFGTGYSSLSHIKNLPIDIIKIDRSFVQNVETDRSDEAIASAIIAMGHSLNLKVIGEGVETENQLQYLRDQGCDEVQGYLFSKAVSATSVPALFV